MHSKNQLIKSRKRKRDQIELNNIISLSPKENSSLLNEEYNNQLFQTNETKQNNKNKSVIHNKNQKKNINKSQNKQKDDGMKQAIEFQWIEGFEPDDSIGWNDIQDPMEYLRRVRHEASSYPEIISVKDALEHIMKSSEYSSINENKSNEILQKKIELKPNANEYLEGKSPSQLYSNTIQIDTTKEKIFPASWVTLQSLYFKKDENIEIKNRLTSVNPEVYVNKFSLYRKMAEHCRKQWRINKCELEDGIECPEPLNWKQWKAHIIHELREPNVFILLSMEYNEYIQLLNQCISWVKNYFIIYLKSDKTVYNILSQSNQMDSEVKSIENESIVVNAVSRTKNENFICEFDHSENMNSENMNSENMNSENVNSENMNTEPNVSKEIIHHLLYWIYTLLSHLEDPISASTLSVINDFTKWLVQCRSKLEENDPLLPDFHTLISIGVLYFSQGLNEFI